MFESGGRDAPIERVFRGDAPGLAFESGVAADVDVSDGHTVLQVWHFSGNICAKNCHGGTREFLSKELPGRGTDPK